MDGWDGQANGERDVLGRIVALLLALAGLADLAAGLSFFRRREVLAILNDGEAAARALLAGMASGPDDGTVSDGPASDPADAQEECRDASLLAARFRALAFMLAVLLSLADFSAPGEAGSFRAIKSEMRRNGLRPRPLHHASRGPP